MNNREEENRETRVTLYPLDPVKSRNEGTLAQAFIDTAPLNKMLELTYI